MLIGRFDHQQPLQDVSSPSIRKHIGTSSRKNEQSTSQIMDLKSPRVRLIRVQTTRSTTSLTIASLRLRKRRRGMSDQRALCREIQRTSEIILGRIFLQLPALSHCKHTSLMTHRLMTPLFIKILTRNGISTSYHSQNQLNASSSQLRGWMVKEPFKQTTLATLVSMVEGP